MENICYCYFIRKLLRLFPLYVDVCCKKTVEIKLYLRHCLVIKVEDSQIVKYNWEVVGWNPPNTIFVWLLLETCVVWVSKSNCFVWKERLKVQVRYLRLVDRESSIYTWLLCYLCNGGSLGPGQVDHVESSGFDCALRLQPRLVRLLDVNNLGKKTFKFLFHSKFKKKHHRLR
jgi:hypothetical protein